MDPRRFDLRAHRVAGLGEVFRARSLEAKDGLLVVADGKDRPQFVARSAIPSEEIIDEGENDIPLFAIGILRLIYKNVIELAIEFVSYPVSSIAVG